MRESKSSFILFAGHDKSQLKIDSFAGFGYGPERRRGFENGPLSRCRHRVSLTPPGSTEQLTVVRDSQRQDITVTISKLRSDEVVAQEPTQSTEELGLTVQMLTPQLAEQFNAKAGEGIVVAAVKPDSIAAKTGIGLGAVIPIDFVHPALYLYDKVGPEAWRQRKGRVTARVADHPGTEDFVIEWIVHMAVDP